MYRFEISGSGADDHTFEVGGVVLCEFHQVFDAAIAETFKELTAGKAIYGSPGVGCKGPYNVRSVMIEQLPQ